MPQDNVIQQGDIQSFSVQYHTSQHSSAIDLSRIWSHFSIYENIERNYIEGEITLVDAQDSFARLPIVSGDRIDVSFKTPSAASSYTFSGSVYEIDSRVQPTQGTQIYVLKFISNEFLVNQRIKFSKAYNQMLISDMVDKIYEQYVSSSTQKKINIVPTLNTTSCVVPMQSPFKAMNWLSQWAVSPEYRDGASYVFFENRHGYYFGPIEALVDPNLISQPAASYKKNITLTDKTDIKEGHNTIVEFDAKGHDHLTSIVTGMYAGRIETHDIVLRQISSQSYNYFDEYSSMQHLEKGTLHNDNNLGAYTDSYVKYTPSHHAAYPNQNSSRTNQTALVRNSQLAQYNDYISGVTVPGDSDRTIGEVIDIALPNASPNLEDSSEGVDKYLSGRYLITALRHILNRKDNQVSHLTKMELSKDSYQTSLPEKLVDPWR